MNDSDIPDASSSALDVAIKAFSAGLAIVPTTAEGRKRPLVRFTDENGTCQAPTSIPDVYSLWQDEFPDAPVAMVTGPRSSFGSGVYVIDIDVKADTPGPRSLNELIARWGELPPTRRVRTPSGGIHLHFRYPDESDQWRNVTGYLPGLDLRGWHGIAVLPGSRDQRGEYVLDVDLPPAELPEAWREGLRHIPRQYDTPDFAARPIAPRDEAIARSEIRTVAKRLTEGGSGKHGRLIMNATIAGSWAHLIPDQEWIVSTLLTALASAHTDAERACGEWDEQRSRKHIIQLMNNGRVHPKWPSSIGTALTDEILAEYGADAIAPGEAEGPQSVNWEVEWDRVEEIEWIVPPLLPVGRQVALFSKAKVGKSLLTLELALGAARGTSVLGYSPRRPYRVMYVDHENSLHGDVITRLKAMGAKQDELANLIYFNLQSWPSLDTAEGGRKLLAEAQKCEAELVIIDTASRTIDGEEESNNTWNNFYRMTGLLLKAAGIALLRLDHSGKDEARGMRGGSAKETDVDAIWKLSPVAGSSTDLELTLQAARFEVPAQDQTVLLHRRADPLRHEPDARGSMGILPTKIDLAVARLDELHQPRDMTYRAAAALLRGEGFKGSDTVFKEAVKRRSMTFVMSGNVAAEGSASLKVQSEAE